jgi:chemotaxis response regulator CheB
MKKKKTKNPVSQEKTSDNKDIRKSSRFVQKKKISGFVVVQHFNPIHASLMTDLLKKYTTMTVVQAEEGMHVEPNWVYVIPPNRDMIIGEGS